MMHVQTGFAEVNGTRLYYEIAGRGSPLVLIHGFTLDTRMWDDQFEAFSQHYRVMRYDARGFGKSASARAIIALSLVIGLGAGYGVSYFTNTQSLLEYRLQVQELQFDLLSLSNAYQTLESNYTALKQEYDSIFYNNNFTELLDWGTFLHQFVGASMEPAIASGDYVLIEMVTPENIEVNDIIAFHSPYNWDTLIVHRVVEIRSLNDQLIFRTKGDNNNVSDHCKSGKSI